jgi:hypothetical protein
MQMCVFTRLVPSDVRRSQYSWQEFYKTLESRVQVSGQRPGAVDTSAVYLSPSTKISV